MNHKTIEIKEGWGDAGRRGILLSESSFKTEDGQRWDVVIWDGEEDPSCVKTAALKVITE